MQIIISIAILFAFALALVGIMLWSATDYDADKPDIDDLYDGDA